MAKGWVIIEGLDDLNRILRKAADKDIPKAVGRAHKRVGTTFVERMLPTPAREATGAGRGATPRASASKREVLLRVGGRHRANQPSRPVPGVEFPAAQQWGKTFTRRRDAGGRFKEAPDRPDIRRAVDRNSGAIVDLYLDEIITELSGIGMGRR